MSNKRGRPRKNKEEIIKSQPTYTDEDFLEEKIKSNPLIEKNNNQISQERRDRLNATLREINKIMPGAVKYASDEPIKEKIPFGIKEIDKLTGNGAICGNFIVIYGSEGTGKTTLVLNQIVTAQKAGKICAYIDLEHGFNKERAIQFGINLEDLVLIEGITSAEEAMDITIKLAKEKVVDYIAIDSIQAMAPIQEMESKKGKEKSMADDEMALLARRMGKFLRVCSPFIYQGKVAVLLIGQVRTEGIGGFATREGLTGGHGVKHWSMMTIYIRKGQGTDAPVERIETEELDEKGKKVKKNQRIGFDAVLKIEKTKTNSQSELSELHIPFYFKTGFYNE